ncbi:MAG: hypothetical protein RL397_662 [Pseudomonadota bacterium]|jgi:hypothetical protein
MSFSRQLLRSLFLLLLLLAVGLLAVVVSQRSLVENAALADRDVFVPELRVERLTAITRALAVPITSGALAADVSFDEACGTRPVTLLTQRLAQGLGLSSLADAHQRLGAAFVAAQRLAPQGCRGFLSEVDLVLRQPGLLLEKDSAGLALRVAQTLTERVSWDSVPPCLYVRHQGQFFYLRGPQGYCLDVAQTPESGTMRGPIGLGTELALGPETRQLVQLAYARLLDPQAVDGLPAQARRLSLTVHPGVARVLDAYNDCWAQPSGCPADAALALHRTAGATVVVLNAQTGTVLGMRCYGPVCNSPSSREAEPLAAALIEAPPASVAKLFFSLALAETGAPPRDLLVQIKTSGLLDPTVVKRNEWWERAALCDLQNRPAGAEPHSCEVPARAMALAERFFWNAQCASDPAACGRVGLSPVSQGLPGFIGLFRPLKGATQATRAGSPSRRYLNWNEYNRIRTAGGRTQIGAPYQEASSAVQAVLGAAESRSSALGLASLASGLYLASQGQPSRVPALLFDTQVEGQRPASPSPETSEAAVASRAAREARSLAAAARLVRQGMTKVMTPAEAGWPGDGTAHPAFRASFGRSCPADCPLEGKTGTVSMRDPRYAGTTTFMGLIDVPRMQQLLGSQAAGFADLPPALALGVIVFSPDRADPARGHGASQLAMRLVRDLVAPQGLTEPARSTP